MPPSDGGRKDIRDNLIHLCEIGPLLTLYFFMGEKVRRIYSMDDIHPRGWLFQPGRGMRPMAMMISWLATKARSQKTAPSMKP